MKKSPVTFTKAQKEQFTSATLYRNGVCITEHCKTDKETGQEIHYELAFLFPDFNIFNLPENCFVRFLFETRKLVLLPLTHMYVYTANTSQKSESMGICFESYQFITDDINFEIDTPYTGLWDAGFTKYIMHPKICIGRDNCLSEPNFEEIQTTGRYNGQRISNAKYWIG